MKTKAKKDLFSKPIKELKASLLEVREVLSGLRLDNSQNKLKNKRSIFHKRREIAQILTVIKTKELEKNA
jgi:ribosomal protein L29